MSHNLDFLFSFVSRYLFPLWFLQWSIGWLVTCCLDFSCLCFLQLYSYIQFVVSEHCIWKTNTQYDFSFLKFREGSLKPLMWFILEKFPCALEKGVYSICIFWYISLPFIHWLIDGHLRCPAVVDSQGLKSVFLPVAELCSCCVSLSRSVPALAPEGPLFWVRLGIGRISWKEDSKIAFASTCSVC